METKHLLLVEDSDDWQEMLSDIFTKWGFTVTLAESIEKAEQFFQQNEHPDIVIMDGCLNSNNTLNSLPLIQKVRNEFNYQGLMIAASGSNEYLKRMIEAGCNEGVGKAYLTDHIRKFKDVS